MVAEIVNQRHATRDAAHFHPPLDAFERVERALDLLVLQAAMFRARDDKLIATADQMYLHVDTAAAKAAPADPKVREKAGQLLRAQAALPRPAPNDLPRGPLGDVYGALVQLGYKPVEIEPLLNRLDPARPVADLVREALGALRRS